MIWERLSPRLRWYWFERDRLMPVFALVVYALAIIMITAHIVSYSINGGQ